jgi:6-phosphogluconolactonase
MKKLSLTFIVLLSSMTFEGFAQKIASFYVGTGDRSPNSVITRCNLDLATGKISIVDSTVHAMAPGYLAISPNKKNLYAVSGDNKITAFSIGADKKLTPLNSQSSEGANPCHVSIHPSGKMAFLANYSGGNISAYTLKSDGSLNPPSYTEQYTGSGPNEKRQEKAHAHYVASSPDGKYVYAADLGTDKIMNYTVDVSSGKLSPNPAQPFFSVKPGSGPRHFAIGNSGKSLFLLNELSATVTACKIEKNGVISEIKTYETIPAGLTGNISAAVHIHPNGKFIYVSNRGHNSITGFKILPNGELELIEEITLAISIPRDFNIDPSGKFMVIGNQDKNNLTVYNVDARTGKLTFLNESVSIKAPLCITFL